jgi:cysteinyl-tRNA synthetase
MAMATLGPVVDIHVGGADLAFPHHAFEAAQAEAMTGVTPFARAWLHVAPVMVDGHKMAKSLGNLVLVHDLTERWPAEALRLLILSQPWNKPWTFEEAAVEKAAARLESLWRQAATGGGSEIAEDAIRRSVLHGLDIRRALEIAEEEGGRPARQLLSLLDLS